MKPQNAGSLRPTRHPAPTAMNYPRRKVWEFSSIAIVALAITLSARAQVFDAEFSGAGTGTGPGNIVESGGAATLPQTAVVTNTVEFGNPLAPGSGGYLSSVVTPSAGGVLIGFRLNQALTGISRVSTSPDGFLLQPRESARMIAQSLAEARTRLERPHWNDKAA